MHNIINWNKIEQTLSKLYSSKRGAPAYPPLMMFKVLILQVWYSFQYPLEGYNLSDEALEKQIARDLMFRRFIDLSLSESVPDHSSIWRFRQLLKIYQKNYSSKPILGVVLQYYCRSTGSLRSSTTLANSSRHVT